MFPIIKPGRKQNHFKNPIFKKSVVPEIQSTDFVSFNLVNNVGTVEF